MLPGAVLGDCAHRLQAYPAGFLQYGGRKTFAGPALTVPVRPGDNLFLHRAVDLAQPGDVIVVDAGGALNSAIAGAIMAAYAMSRGIEAIVVDGAIRDAGELQDIAFAMVARGATPNGPFKSGPGEIGHPIACGGLSISPGDLVLGDPDGVMVIPRQQVPHIAGAAEARLRMESEWQRQVSAGTWDRAWVTEALAKLA